MKLTEKQIEELAKVAKSESIKYLLLLYESMKWDAVKKEAEEYIRKRLQSNLPLPRNLDTVLNWMVNFYLHKTGE